MKWNSGMSTTIEEALRKFMFDLKNLTGEDSPLVRIDFSPELFSKFMIELAQKNLYRLNISSVNDFVFMGVRINARHKYYKDDQ